MTVDEVKKIIAVITATYPAHFRGYTKSQMDNLISAWNVVIADYDYPTASAGLKVFLANDTKGFPPSPGQVIDCIHNLNQENHMTAAEAWSLARKAIGNGNYHAEEEFNKLPPLVQRAIGSPQNIRNAAMMDVETVESVEQSHFVRAYNTLVEREKEMAKIPQSVRNLIEEKKNGLPEMQE